MRSLSLLLLLFPLAACKPKGSPGGVSAGSTLIDPGPAQLPQGWALADHGAGFTLGFPEGWQTKSLDRPAIEKFVNAQNENAWGIMNERKAEVDFEKCTGMAGIREFFAVGEAMEQRRFIDPALDTANNLKIEWWNLTTRESDVVVALCKGWSAAKICEHYAIRPKTLSANKRAAMAKLDISEEAGLAAYIIENGLDYLLDE